MRRVDLRVAGRRARQERERNAGHWIRHGSLLGREAAADLGVDLAPRTTTLRVEEPAARKAGIKVADVADLVKRLKEEAKVL